jgi:hypothetical protein
MKNITFFFILTFMCSTFAFSKEAKLSCVNMNFYDGSFMYAKVLIESNIEINEESYKLKNLNLSYLLSMEEDFSDEWASAIINDQEYSIGNLESYNPRVYKDHIKFKNIHGDKVFGSIDLIIPVEVITNIEENKVFNSYTIMTAMDDHWGGTVSLDCSISTEI